MGEELAGGAGGCSSLRFSAIAIAAAEGRGDDDDVFSLDIGRVSRSIE